MSNETTQRRKIQSLWLCLWFGIVCLGLCFFFKANLLRFWLRFELWICYQKCRVAFNGFCFRWLLLVACFGFLNACQKIKRNLFVKFLLFLRFFVGQTYFLGGKHKLTWYTKDFFKSQGAKFVIFWWGGKEKTTQKDSSYCLCSNSP